MLSNIQNKIEELEKKIIEQNHVVEKLKLHVEVLQSNVKELNRQMRVLQRDTWFNKCLNGLDTF